MAQNKWMYIRTSTEDQEPENQIENTETISGKDYGLFKDKQSAWKDNKDRPDFERLKLTIKRAKGGDLYVWDWDRLFRNRKKLKEFFQFCAVYKCRIHSFRQRFFESFYEIPAPFDEIMQELFLNLLGWLAEDESTKKSDRVKAAVRRVPGKATRSRSGKKWGRRTIKVDDKIITAHKEGMKILAITKEVYYWDKNKHKKFVSAGYVHKVITQYKDFHKLSDENKPKLTANQSAGNMGDKLNN